MLRTTSLSLFVLALTASGSAMADGTWQIIASADGLTPGGVPNYPNAVFTPNQFSNPLIDGSGRVYFKAQCAGGPTSGPNGGPWIGTGGTSSAPQNSRMFLSATSSADLAIIAQDSGSLPGGLLPGYQLNSYLWASGVTSNNPFMSRSGSYLWNANVNTTTGTATVSANQGRIVFHGANGSNSIMYTAGAATYPGTSLTFTTSTGSPQYLNDDGSGIFSLTLAGTGVVTSGNTANNGATAWISSTGVVTPLIRKGDAAPGFGDGTIVQPSAYGNQINGNYWILGSNTLLNPTGTTTASTTPISTYNNSIYYTNVGSGSANGFRQFARKGSPLPGIPTMSFVYLQYPTTASFSFPQHPISADGTILFYANVSGTYPDGTAIVQGLNDVVLMTDKNGANDIWLRKGQSYPGFEGSGLVFSTVSVSDTVMNNNRQLAYSASMMNPDGTPPTPGVSFFGVRKQDGTLLTICKEGDSIPGISGATFGSMTGSSYTCMSDNNVVVWSNSYTSGGQVSAGVAILAWDPAQGLRVIAKTGDTSYTGTPINQITLVGSTGVTGNGTNTGINSNGVLTVRFGDSTNSAYAIGKISLGLTACPADLNGDRVVNGADLGIMLSSWGACGSYCPADLNHDGVVDGADLGSLLAAWGNCPN